jgi:hypothetical protein
MATSSQDSSLIFLAERFLSMMAAAHGLAALLLWKKHMISIGLETLELKGHLDVVENKAVVSAWSEQKFKLCC